MTAQLGATAEAPDEIEGELTAAEMLTKLQQLHEVMDRSIAAIGEIIRQPSPDEARIIAMRWQFGQARSSRYRLVEHICTELSKGASAHIVELLAGLRDANRKILVVSAEQISKWTMDEVRSRWDEYRRVIRTVQSNWQHNVQQEKTILYPLLAQRGLR